MSETKTQTDRLTSFDLGRVAGELERVRCVLFCVEQATSRKFTPGRLAAARADADSISTIDATTLHCAERASIPLEAVRVKAMFQMDAMIEKWEETNAQQ